ncbi:hypothetical protein KAFR_0B05730 [Kazachstania africana CBS 2517]|uniref:ZIP zinc/iron transport family n=1 Tax=Kazachstania africana (strain ATCC 22294 / BCRC 22015 / CBS 2517 / CECT 1963 / NBRC 1671 / NRRL Y-8276) TaxID=1071382 RepID=H2AR69_KAZAF|nr:hypothetical protein KAFR_0B05730 [Kazachstania africana CBS 2517]CCF56869.1 hypothetical protein KAFR_0B05730 [Kazachstania africana CBS 2517]
MSELIPRDTCQTSNDYNGSDNLRILAVFMILISSALGAFFPLLSSKYSFIKLPNWCFFIAKFFGSGVIVATAFIHLLEPASDALTNDCLGGTFADYPWAFGICLMSLFFLFFSEICSHYFILRAYGNEDHSHFPSGNDDSKLSDVDSDKNTETRISNHRDIESGSFIRDAGPTSGNSFIPGRDHYSHDAVHQDPSQLGTPAESSDKENYANQIFAVSILEFGIVFHSVFIGLSLAVAGEEFKTLFVVLIFHQMFEGLGLGTRLAETNWPKSKKLTPWIMALGYSITTPISTAIGIGVRHSFLPESRKALIVNGVFDAFSAGILIYTGLVELMAHEFLYSSTFKQKDGLKRMLLAYLCMATGAGIMALLGKWA